MDFGEVLSSAWKIIWKHKVLWIFGILVSCSNGGGTGGGGGNTGFQDSGGDLPPEMYRFFDFLAENVWLIVLIILVFLFLVILSVFLGTVGKIGLVKGTLMADAGAERLAFGELFSGSLPYFWRVFGLALLVGLALVGVFMLFFLPILAVGILAENPIILICLVPIVCVFIPFAWAVGVVLEQSIVAVVAENLGISAALRRGWDVVRKNPGSLLVMALVLLIGGGIVGFIIAIPVLLIVTPVIFSIAISPGSAVMRSLLFAGLCFVLYLPFLLLLHGILMAYVQSAWTLTFLRLTRATSSVEQIEPANA